MKIKVLELFAGSRSVGKCAESLGMEVFSVDWTNYENIDLVCDIGTLTKDDVPFIPDVVWSSPDCKTYSIAAISHHRNGTRPKSDYAKQCDIVNINWLNLISEYLTINPDMIYFIENPVGMMRKMPFMKNIPRTSVTYCSYSDDRMKPTDIWSNNIRSLFNPDGWQHKPRCFNGNTKCHHEPAPRGSKTGTQGKSGSYDRSKIPEELCFEVLNSVIIKNLL